MNTNSLEKISYTNAIKFPLKKKTQLSPELEVRYANVRELSLPIKKEYLRKHCISHVNNEISFTKPKVAITLGRVAEEAARMSKQRTGLEFIIHPIPHPSSRERYSAEQVREDCERLLGEIAD